MSGSAAQESTRIGKRPGAPGAPAGGAISDIAAPAESLAELIAASARGDERAFQRLYLATSDALFGMALRILKRRDWAEEVLQESFVRVWRHAGRYDRNKGAPMTWLFRIVHNQALDWISPSRADGFERAHGQALDDPDQFLHDVADSGHHAHPAELADYARRADRITACLAHLEARHRQSIVLVFFHGLSHGDLARHLRQPLGTVKAWVRRGLKSLGACLAAREAR
jgi:RNA polymerase sigma-70 factor, ECF subfamily